MANNQSQPPEDAGLQEEERLEGALKHLKELHLQLRQLRSVLPRMLEPISYNNHGSPQAVYGTFMESVGNAQKELNDFKAAFNSKKTHDVFQKGMQSRRANPKGIKPWRARDDPEWTTLKRKREPETSENA